MLIINTALLSVYACVVLEIVLGDGGVEIVEALHLEGAPLSAALLTSSALLILNSQVKPTRKNNKILSSELIHA